MNFSIIFLLLILGVTSTSYAMMTDQEDEASNKKINRQVSSDRESSIEEKKEVAELDPQNKKFSNQHKKNSIEETSNNVIVKSRESADLVFNPEGMARILSRGMFFFLSYIPIVQSCIPHARNQNSREPSFLFDNLPSDIQKLIFEFLEGDDLKKASGISKKWHELVTPIKDEKIIRDMWVKNNIEKYKLQNDKWIKDLLFEGRFSIEIGSKNKGILCKNECVDMFCLLLRDTKTINKIHISNLLNVSDDSINVLFSALKINNTIRKICVGKSSCIKTDFHQPILPSNKIEFLLSQIEDLLNKNKRIKEVELSSCGLKDGLHKLIGGAEVRIISLKDNKINNLTSLLLVAIDNNKFLSKLNLQGNPLSKDDIEKLKSLDRVRSKKLKVLY